jgi:hypothetical protein
LPFNVGEINRIGLCIAKKPSAIHLKWRNGTFSHQMMHHVAQIFGRQNIDAIDDRRLVRVAFRQEEPTLRFGAESDGARQRPAHGT